MLVRRPGVDLGDLGLIVEDDEEDGVDDGPEGGLGLQELAGRRELVGALEVEGGCVDPEGVGGAQGSGARKVGMVSLRRGGGGRCCAKGGTGVGGGGDPGGAWGEMRGSKRGKVRMGERVKWGPGVVPGEFRSSSGKVGVGRWGLGPAVVSWSAAGGVGCMGLPGGGDEGGCMG